MADAVDCVADKVFLPILVHQVVGGTMAIVLAEAKVQQNLPVKH